MKYLLNPSTDPWFNMAFDELCLRSCPNGESFFYLWRNRPSVIIGFNQNAREEVNLPYLEEKGILLARRVTGGGAVYHDLQNLNYSFVGGDVTPGPFVDALRSLGVDAQLTGRNDIFVDGRKVSGYAKRFEGDCRLVHGTLMYDVDIDTLTHALDTPVSKLHRKGVASVRSRVANLKDCLPQFASLDEVQAALQDILSAGDGQIDVSKDFIARAEELSRTRFATPEWIFRR